MARRRKILIIVLFQNLGDADAWYAKSPAPPLPGLLLAALTPPEVDVEVLHEMVRPINYHTDAECVALSFMDYCAPHAFEVARRFRMLGKIVIAGGKYASSNPEEVQPHVDCVVVGEAERIWPRVVDDYLAHRLAPRYDAPFGAPLDHMPPPRYDLAEKSFSVPIVTEATRGCPYSCSFCRLTLDPADFRTRPVEDVIRDLTATDRLPPYKRRMAMLYDNNLGGDLAHAKELLRAIAKTPLWAWGAQFSFDCLHDSEFVELLARSRCRMAFIGMESLNDESLAAAHKAHNRVAEYRELFRRLRRAGILTFAGLMFGLEADTPEYLAELRQEVDKIGPEVLLMSLAIPIPGTPFHKELAAAGRITDFDLAHYDGDHLVFTPNRITRPQLLTAYAATYRRFFGWGRVLQRWQRFLASQPGAGLMPHSILGNVIATAVYFQLTVFQRHHAERRLARDLP